MKKTKKNILKYPLYEDMLISELKQNPRRAAAYLEASLEAFYEDGNTDAFLLALRHLAAAQGGFSALAKKTSLNRQGLYRMLSRSGNPRLDTLGAVINALGFQLTIKPKANRAHGA
ncbi:MAG: addiction module antidote protein [Legionellales bacterium]|jgi:probable addiction module antidote protein